MESDKTNIALTTVTIFIAFVILSTSFLKTVSIKYAYSPMVLSEKSEIENTETIEYFLAYQGKINPDSPLWYLKAMRDRMQYVATFNPLKKAELNLLNADKRLNSSIELFKNNKPDLGLSTLTKAEKYLQKSLEVTPEDNEFYKKLALASLKHIEVINNEIIPNCPEDLKPEVTLGLNTTYMVYSEIKNRMLSKGLIVPDNPFEKR